MENVKNQSLVVSALNDLLKINNDRVQGYQKAIELTSDENLKTLFQQLAFDSSKNINELSDQIFKINGKPQESTTMGGKFYRTWMDVKAAFTGNDKHSLLVDCEYGEDMALDAYKKVENDEDLNLDHATNTILVNQKQRVEHGHDAIKRLRDTTK
ncbi:ferritin-like domain-containing protein [Solitalea canadensis]|uniref:DUF2383 domain-containing protein n=1 Tax=Solitalea canadensis (strain ATCC 29591 / DSM 3403 / JCM 21819 / LMG 8368 / NBRC 15130 / NCIMB 12057 / USAM 9D) TaxID=929556 RepID=H8KQ30_SOLCM|nr:PA2169 family four-helix-bundle protein [Solitalea canadensis]AFD06198.1 hypothetical protein Solca_1092 [Solitalea canadensis DSM 3403]